MNEGITIVDADRRLVAWNAWMSAIFGIDPALFRRGRRVDAEVEAHQRAKGADDTLAKPVDLRVTRIRRKIEDDPAKPQVIKTVRRAGYISVPG